MKQCLFPRISTLALAVFAATQTMAQPVANKPPAGTSMLEETVVTATRREERAQTVAVSAIVMTSRTLEENSVRELGDLTRMSPGLRFVHQGGGGNMNVSLRGLERIPVGSAPNAVINYFADVPLDFNGSNIPTFDLASIQVFRGPQGTLFGRNAIGGAVVITPEAPSYEYEGYIKGAYGNSDYTDLEGALNIPIIDDKLALRVAGKTSDRDGFTDNIYPGKDDLDNVNREMYRISLLFEPTENFRNTTIYDYMKADEAGTAAILTNALDSGLVRLQVEVLPGVFVSPFAAYWDCHTASPFTNPVPCSGFQPDKDIDDALERQKKMGYDHTVSEINGRNYRELAGLTNRTEWDIGPVTIRNIFGYRTTKVEQDLNTDGVAFEPPIITASNRVNLKQTSNETHVFGDAFNDKIDYLVGVFYIKEEPDGKNGSIFPVAAPVAPWVQSFTEKTNKAVFGNIGYDITDTVKFNLGYRYNETEQKVCANSINMPTNIEMNPQPPLKDDGACKSAAGSSNLDSDENEDTYNIGFDWQINDDNFAYVTHRKGFREGGINSPAFNTPGSIVLAPYQTYEPETLEDYEIGLKNNFQISDVYGRFNIAVFTGKHHDFVKSYNTSGVVPAADPGSPQSSAIGINSGDATLSGVETTLVLQLTDNLSIANNLSYNDFEIDNVTLPNVPGLQPPSLVPASPDWATTTTLRWILPWTPLQGELTFNADYYWQDKFLNGNDSFDSYDLANLRLDWSGIGQSGVDVSLFVRNVTDEEYAYASGASSASLGIFTKSFAEPRMYGLEVSYRFGDE